MKILSLLLLTMLIPGIVSATNTELSTPGTNIGIGTNSVANNISLTTGVAIGDSTYTQATSPTQGAIVEGNVGIKTTSPTQALDVGGTVKSTSFIQTGSVANSMSGNLGLGASAPAGILDIEGTLSPVVFFGTNPPANGINNNVGIGTFAPTRPVYIFVKTPAIQTSQWTNTLIQDSDGLIPTTNGNQATLRIASNVNSLPIIIGLNNASSSNPSYMKLEDTDGTTGKLGMSATGFTIGGYTNYNLELQANAATKMTILTGGNVGIGSVNPVQKLDVNGTVQSTSFIQTGSTINSLNGNTGIGNSSPTQALDVSGTVKSTSFIQTGSTINSFNGNVGIGSITPGQALDVNGTVRSLGLIMNAGGNIGIGTTNQTAMISGTVSASSARERFLEFSASDATNDTFGLANFTATNGRLGGAVVGMSTTSGIVDLNIVGETDSTNDVGNATTVISLNGRVISGDYLSGTSASLTSRPIVQIQNNGTIKDTFDFNGNLGIGSVAPGNKLDVQGTIRATSYQSSDSSVGVTGATCSSFKNGICVAT